VLAERYQWTPDEVCLMDPDFVEEVLIRLGVEAEIAEGKRKAAERERKRREKKFRKGDDADLSEIV
jgi:hypothetical protein